MNGFAHKMRQRKELTSLAFSEILKASSAVCEAFLASALAESKHFRPSSILDKVRLIFVNKLFPDKYEAEKRSWT